MKKIFGKLCMGGVLLFSLSMSLTSCEDILGHWEKPTPNPITPGGNVTPPDEGGSTPVLPTLDLSTVTAATTIEDGYTVTGTLAANVQISIADGATVTLDGVTINGVDDENCKWAGITCEGDATIILKDGTTNTVKGFYDDYPGIHPAVGHTLIIKGGTAGTGSLDASSNGYGAGIGGGNGISCGNIEIQGGKITAAGGSGDAGIGSGGDTGVNCGTITISGGDVTATGGNNAAGIGSGYKAGCGAITISGGTVTATGGSYAAGIGSGKGVAEGSSSQCGNITITTGVTSVTATKGDSAPNSIGKGQGSYSSCGTVTIGGNVGEKTTSPYIYPTPVPDTAINGKFTINAAGDQVYFAKGNLQATTTDGGTNWSWGFATNQWDFVGNKAANNAINGNGTVSTNGTVDLFGWSTAATTYGIHNSTTDGVYSGDFKDWGGKIGTGWRTLSKDEWDYLFFTRASGSKVNSLATTNARYTHATINTDNGSDGINGIILFPDGVTINYSDATYWGAINEKRNWNGATKCTTSQWNALAAKGFVFLPAAGYRYNGTTIGLTNGSGYYWSSTLSSDSYSFYTRVLGSNEEPTTVSGSRQTGISVRLVYPID